MISICEQYLHSFFAKDELDVTHETLPPRQMLKVDALFDIGMLLSSKPPMKVTEKLL